MNYAVKALVLLLFLAGSARAQAPDSAALAYWHWGESSRDATDRILGAPGWRFVRSTDSSPDWRTLRFVANNEFEMVDVGLYKDQVLRRFYYYARESAGAWVLSGATPEDGVHWVDPAHYARITRSYNGTATVYTVDFYAPPRKP